MAFYCVFKIFRFFGCTDFAMIVVGGTSTLFLGYFRYSKNYFCSSKVLFMILEGVLKHEIEILLYFKDFCLVFVI